MLRPDIQWSNPVMFVVEIGAVLTLLFIIQALVSTSASQVPITYFIALDAWLFLTVLFANIATALAEARGKAQAESLRKTRSETPAYRLKGAGVVEEVRSTELKPGDRVVVTAGQVIPSEGEIIEGIVSVDESAITGESAPVIREAGGDRSGVTGGTLVISDRIVVNITAPPGQSFLDRMIALVEGAARQKTPNEIALTLALSGPNARFFDRRSSALADGLERGAIHDELSRNFGATKEPRHRRSHLSCAAGLSNSNNDRSATRGNRNCRHGSRAPGQHHR